MEKKLDKMFFGEYCQDETYPTPIEWYILKKENEHTLLFSVNSLEIMPFYGKWEDSMLREWLNNGFYSVAFNEIEKQKIIENISYNNLALEVDIYDDDLGCGYRSWKYINQELFVYGNPTRDKVFLPDYRDVKHIYSDNCYKCTEHAKNNSGCKKGGGYWWTRTCEYRSDKNHVCLGGRDVDTKGIDYYGNIEYEGVRPCIWIKE